MTFEEAWPEIKEGKEFKYKVKGRNSWVDWFRIHDLLQPKIIFMDLLNAEFQIKREAREWGLYIESNSNRALLFHPAEVSPLGIIKVREVIE